MSEATTPRSAVRTFWPDTSQLQGAVDASRQGMWASFFVAAATAVFAALAIAGTSISAGIDGTAFVDVLLFAALGWGIRRFSRVAAILALLLFVAEKIYMWSFDGPRGVPLAVIIFLAFVAGVRGTFAYHSLTRPATAVVLTGPGTSG